MKRSLNDLIAVRFVTEQLTRMEHTEEPTQYGMRRTSKQVPNGTIAGTVEVRVDVEALVRYLGGKALRSKRGVSRGMSGMIEARTVKGTLKRTKP